MFEGGAKLSRAEFDGASACAVITYEGKRKFSLKFENADCVHIAPIATGNPFVEEVTLGRFAGLFFFADGDDFDPTSPDTSLTYIIGKTLYLGK